MFQRTRAFFTRLFSRTSKATRGDIRRRQAFKRRKSFLEGLEQRSMLATFQVSLTGSDSNTGGVADPFRTIQAAINAASNTVDGNDIINVATGVYNTVGVDKQFTIGSTASPPVGLSNLQLLGGWDTTFTTRNPAATPTDYRFTDPAASFRYDIQVYHPNTTIDGFTLRSSDNTTPREADNVLVGATGATISNNIMHLGIRNGGSRPVGVVTTSADVSGLKVTNNQFNANFTGTPAGSTYAIGVFLNPGAISTNQLIDGNTFQGNNYAAMIDNSGGSNLTISNNSFTRNAAPANGFQTISIRNSTALSNITIDSNTINGNGNGSGITIGDGGAQNVSNLNVTRNIIQNHSGVGLSVAPGTGQISATIQYNLIQGNTFAGLFRVAPTGSGSMSINATKNWWGDISGPTTAANPGGLGQVINDSTNIAISPWLIYNTDANPAAAGVQLPTTVTVVPGADTSAADNAFRRLDNAIRSAAAGQTIDIQGLFNWNQPNAAAGYQASVANSDTADIRGIELPDAVNNLTITSSTLTGRIIGGGDAVGGQDYESFVYTDDSWSGNGGANAVGNTNLTIEKLQIDDFENSVFVGWNGTGVFHGTKIRNNQITVAGDDGNINDLQNIAVYLIPGLNQQVTGNTITFQGDGTRAVGSGARSFGFQNSTSGGTLYDGLQISGNTFQVGASSTGETVYGIWENSHSDDNAADISLSGNQFIGRAGDLFDRTLVLSSQSTGLVIDGNSFTDVDNVAYANDNSGPSPGDTFRFTNNVLTRVGGADGVFLTNVTSGPTTINYLWNVNNTVDGFTGVRGLNELSTQATGASRPTGAATFLNSVSGTGTLSAVYVDDNWGSPARFTNPIGIGVSSQPIAFGYNTQSTIAAGIAAVDAGGDIYIRSGSYAETLDASSKSVNILPGNSPGQVAVNGIALDSNDTLTMELDGTNAATEFDNFLVTGGVALGNANLALQIHQNPAGGIFKIIDNDSNDPVTGTFAGLPNLTTFFVSGIPVTIDYAGGDGNDVVLTIATPTQVWVNDNWVITTDNSPAGLSTGDIVANTGAGDNGTVTNKTFGYNAFTTVQQGVNAVNAGGTVSVLNNNGGSYSENVTINKAVVLNGETVTLGAANKFILVSGEDVAGSTGIGAPTVDVQLGAKISDGAVLANVGGLVNVAAGTFNEDVLVGRDGVRLIGAGAASTTIIGPIGGNGATLSIAANNVEVTGFTITRAGNTVALWNDPNSNTAGLAIQGSPTGALVHDNVITGNRNGVDVNNSSGHTIRNNVVTGNRTGFIFRNQTDNMTVVENEITDNFTVGILFLDASGGTNSPVQTAANSTFSNNNISGNWYGQIVDRQTGGSLPAPGGSLKNFSGNWFGTASPVITSANSTEPGYAVQIPTIYGGSATAPGGQPDIAGPASANFDITPYLNAGTDTNVETTLGRGTFGFQGNYNNLTATAQLGQTGATGRIQEAVNALTTNGTIIATAGTYAESVNFDKGLTLRGPNFGVAGTGVRAAEAIITGNSLITSTATTPVTINGLKFQNNVAGGSTLWLQSANGHIVTNSVFESTIAGGGSGDRAIETNAFGPGTSFTISNNKFAGNGTFAATDKYSTSAWTYGIYHSGQNSAAVIANNRFENTRSAMGLDDYPNATASVTGNTIVNAGTGIGINESAPFLGRIGSLTSVTNNTFDNVDADFSLRNLTGNPSFDLAAAGNAAVSGDAMVVLGGLGNETLVGTAGVDVFVGDDNGAAASTDDSNTFTGGASNDYLRGAFQQGIDVALYAASLSLASFTPSSIALPGFSTENGWLLASGGAEGTDSLVEIEVVDGAEAGRFLLVGNGGFPTIQAAVNAAVNGDTIIINSGTYVENVSIGVNVTLAPRAGVSILPVAGNALTIAAGATRVVGTLTTGSFPTVVQSGSTLGGTGTISGPVTANAGAFIDPGFSPGIFATGNYNQAGTLNIEIVRPAATQVAGTDFDQLQVTGTVTLSGPLNLIFTGAGTIADFTSFKIIDNDGTGDAVSGVFTGLPNNSTFTANGQSWAISYTGGDGNDVVLVTVPSLTPTTTYAEDTAWNSLTIGTVIADADFTAPGNQPAVFGYSAFTGVQAAVNAVASAGTVVVNQGTYAENIILNKQLTMLGAQRNVDARGRVVGAPNPAVESILSPASGRTIELGDLADNTTLNGLAVISSVTGSDGAISSQNGAGAGNNNLTIQNNYVSLAGAADGSALFLNRSAIDALIQKNDFRNNSGNTLFFDAPDQFHGLRLLDNNVTHVGAAGGTGLFVDGNRNVSNIGSVNTPLIKGNVFSNYSAGANLGRYAFANGEISENMFTGSTGVGIQGGIANSLIARNTFSGTGAAAQGLQLRPVFGEDPTDATKGAFNNLVTENFFSGNSVADVFLSEAQFPGTIGTNVITGNSFTSAVSVFYRGSETVNLSGNWYGTNTTAGVPATTQNSLNEQQWVGIKNVAGQFKLIYNGNSTVAITPGSSAAPVQTALEALPGIGVGNVIVRAFGTSLDVYRRVYVIEFTGALAGTNVNALTVDPFTLTGGAASVASATLANGGHPYAIDYTPWLNTGTDTSLGLIGFQGDFSNLHVDDNSPQSGATGRITEAVGLLTATGTIQIHTGTYTENVSTAGKAVNVAPGASPGQVTLIGNLTLDSNDTLAIEVDGTNAATQYDNFLVTGSVTLGNAVLSISGSYVPTASDSFTLISNDLADSVSGTFNGLPATTLVNVNGIPKKILYTGGDGNDVVLVPAQPTTTYAEDTLWTGFVNGQVIADADFTTAGNQPAIYGYDAFSTIQGAVNAVAVGGTVIVNGGTYNEDVTMSGKTGILLQGIAGSATTTIVGQLGGANETLLIDQGQTVDGFTITRVTGGGENNIGVTLTTGATGMTLRNSVLSGNRTGIYANGGNSSATITRNVIDNNRTGVLFVDPSYGIYQITENQITNNKTFGIIIQPGVTSWNSATTIFNNSISGNYASQLENNSAAATVNASGNWWGTNNPVFIAADVNSTLPPVFAYPGPAVPPGSPYPYQISGSNAAAIDFTPYLNGGTDTAPATPGFQGDFSSLVVHAVAGQTGSVGRIQEGVNLVTAGGTVAVRAGSYAENVTINKALSLLGAQQGVDADTRFAAFTTGVNGPKANTAVEAVLTAPTNAPTAGNPGANDLIRVLASNVTIDGLVIDGNNPLLPASSVVTGGVNLHARRGITNVDATNTVNPINNLLVQNNIVQNVGERGISLSGAASLTGNSITDNVFRNYGNLTTGGYGVLLLTNAYANVTNNTFDVAGDMIGLQLQNFSNNGVMTWSGNDVTVGQDAIGILTNLFYASSATVNVQNNIVHAATGVTGASDFTWGVYVLSVQVGSTVNLTNNTIGATGGQFARGVNLWNNPTSVPIAVSGGTIGNSVVGINHDGVDPFFGTSANSSAVVQNVAITGGTIGVRLRNTTIGATVPGGNLSLSLSGNTITGATTGIAVEDGTADAFTTSLTIGAGNVVSTGTTGLSVNGAQASLAGNTLNNIAFSGQTGNYITLSNGALDTLEINGTAATFGGLTGAAATVAQNYAIEDKITHAIDDAAQGFIRVKAGNTFVTPNSFIIPATTTASIQRAIDEATTGNTVNVQGGSYTGGADAVTGGKNLTISLGASPAQVTVVGNVALNSGDTLAIEVEGTSAATQYDNLLVTGTVSLGNATLTISGSYVPAAADAFTLINNDAADSVTGTFNLLPPGTLVNVNGTNKRIFYTGNDGNDVVLLPATPATAYVDDNWSAFVLGQFILDADLGTTGNQSAIFGYDAFATMATGLAAATTSNIVIVNGGNYAEAVVGVGTKTIEITGPDAAQSVIFNSLATAAGQGVVLEGSSTLTFGDSTATTITGVISGSGALVKAGAGTVIVNGVNTYTGATTINAGTLNIQNSTALGTSLNGTTVADGATLQLQGGIAVVGEALSLTGEGLSNAGGLRSISGNNSWSGNITVAYPASNITRVASDANTLTISGNININGSGSTQFVVQGNGATTISGVISGAGRFTRSSGGTGVVTLSGNNTYAGGTIVSGGTLVLQGPKSTTGNTSIGSGTTTLRLTDANSLGATASQLLVTGGTPTIQLWIDGPGSNGTITLPQSFGGSAGITTIFDVNNFGGGNTNNLIHFAGTAANWGTATMNVTGGNGYGLSFARIGVSTAAGTATFNPTTARLAIGTIVPTTSNNYLFVLGGTNTASQVTGVIADSTGAGLASVEKQGTGTWTLGGANLYEGTTTVTTGTLVVNGSIFDGAAAVDVNVNNSAILAGNGSISGVVNVNNTSRLAPGVAGAGALATGNLAFVSGTFFDVEIGGTTAGTNYDQVNVSGTVTLANATLNLQQISGFTVNTAVAQQFIIITNDGSDAVSGTFNGLPEGSPVTYAGGTLYVSYSGNDGNDVVLYSQPTVNGTAGADTLVLRQLSGTQNEFSLNGAPFVAVTNTLPFLFNGQAGTDLMLVDTSNGDPIATGNVAYVGELLRVQKNTGAASDTATYAPTTTAGTGTVQLTGFGDINFSGTTNVDFVNLTTVNLQTATLADTLTLADGNTVTNSGTVPGGYSITAAAALTLTGANAVVGVRNVTNANLTTVTGGGDGNDAVTINTSTGAFGVTNLAVATGSGTDTVTVTGALTVSGNINISSQNIAVNNTLTGGATNSVTLNAGAGAITTSGVGTDVAAQDLIASATTGIDLDTNVLNITATNSGAGSITIDELNGANVLNVATTTGAATVTSTTGNLNVTTVSASTTVTLTATAGSITDANVAASNVSATSLTATAATGIDLDTTITTLTSANVTGIGAIDISDTAGGLVVTSATTADGAIALNATSGDLTLTTVTANGTGRNVTATTTTSGNVLVDNVTAAGDNIQITAVGSLTEVVAGDAAADLTSATATLAAGTGIGAAGAEIEVDFTTLTSATVSGTGLINLNDLAGGLVVTLASTNNGSIFLTATGGNLTLTSVTAGGAGGNVTAGTVTSGNILVALVDATGDAISLTTAAGGNISETASDAAADLIAASATLSASTGIGNGNAIETTLTSLTATNSTSGNIEIAETDAITLTSVVQSTDNDANDIIITAGGTITVGVVNAGTANGDVTLTATSGSIVDDVSDAVADVIGDFVTITAVSAVGQAAGTGSLDTTANSLDVSVTAAGSMVLNETNAVTLVDLDTADGSITVTAGGTITATDVQSLTDATNVITLTASVGDILVDNVSAVGDTILLNAAGAIEEVTPSDAGADLTASVITATAVNGIGNAATIEINTITSLSRGLTATVTGTGAIDVLDVSGGLRVLSATTANGDITIVATTGDIFAESITSSTDIDANDVIVTANAGNIIAGVISAGATAGDVTLTATGGSITDDANDAVADVIGDVVIMTATSGVGESAGNGTLDTTANSLDVSVIAAGLINLTETNAVTLTDIDTFNGPITITAGGAIIATDVASLTDNDANDISITATTGNITVGLITAGTTAGDVTLLASAGSIIDDANDSTADVIGDFVTMTASAGVGESAGNGALDTTANSLDVSVTAAGLINLNETNGVTLTDIDTANGSITIVAGGTMTATDVASLTDADANDITLTTTIGNIAVGAIVAGVAGDAFLTAALAITDIDAVNPDITADDIVLLSTAGVGTSGDPLETAASNLESTGGSGGVFVANTGSLTIGGIGGTVGLSATGGSIVVTTTGGLTVSENVTATGTTTDVVLTAIDAVAAGQNLVLNAGTTISSASAAVTLNAGDNATINGNITSGGFTTINIDFGDAESVGATATAGDGGTLTIAPASVITTPNTAAGGAYFNSGNDYDTFTFNPQTTTTFFVDGDLPVGGILGDVLQMDVSGTVNPNLTVPGSATVFNGKTYNGPGSGIWTFDPSHRNVYFKSIEDSQVSGPYHLTYDNSVAPVGNLVVMLDGTPSPNELLQFRNGSTAGPILYQTNLSPILSVRVLGGAGADVVTIDDINGLPSFGGSVPASTGVGNHPSTSDTDASPAPEFFFDAGTGTNVLNLNLNRPSTQQQFAFGTGTAPGSLEAEIQSTNATTGLNAYVRNVGEINRTGVGASPGGLTVFGTTIANDISISNNGGGETRVAAVGHTSFDFSGNNYNAFVVNPLAGNDTVDLISFGTAQTNNWPITLNGNDDNDTIRVRSTSGNTGNVTLNGNLGSDTFQLYDGTTTAGTVDNIAGAVVVDGSDGNVGGITDTLVIIDNSDNSADNVLVSAVSPGSNSDYAVEGINGIVGNDVVLRNIDTLNYTGTLGNDTIDGRFVNTVPTQDLDTVSLSGWTGADQFLLFTSNQLGGSGAGFTPSGISSAVGSISLYGDAPGNPNAGDGNDIFGATPPGVIGTGLINVGLVVPDSVRMIRPSATTSIAIDGGRPTGPQPPVGDVVGDKLNLDISALPNTNPVVVSTFSPGTVFAGSLIASTTWTEIEDFNMVDQGKLTNVQMGDLFARTTPGQDLVQFASNPTAGNPNQVRLRINATIANYSASGKTIIYSGGGNDTITQANLTIPAEFYGEDGDDNISGAIANDWLVGGTGNDRINGGRGNNVIWGDNSPTTPTDPQPQDTAVGGDDSLSGLEGNDVFYGGAGNDQVSAGGGNDYANGGLGNDVLDGFDGDDRLYGGAGNDTVTGSTGNDLLMGNDGDDLLYGNAGNDVLVGGAGTDLIDAGDGNDLIVSGSVSNENSSWTSQASAGTFSAATYTNGSDNDAALLILLTQWGVSNNRSSIGSITHDGVNDDLYGSLGDDDFCWEMADVLDNPPGISPPDYNAPSMGSDERFGPT